MSNKNGNKEEKIFNIITLGDSGVGKTSIIKRYLYRTFDEQCLSTIGLSFGFQDVDIGNDKIVRLRLVDTAGQEKYKSLSKSYLKNADAVLYVFSYDKKKSFDLINNWFDFYEQNGNPNNVVQFLIGNKNDVLNGEKNDVDKIEPKNIDEIKSKYKIKDYYSISAKTNCNIEKLFLDLAIELEKNKKEEGPQQTKKLEDHYKNVEEKTKKKKKKNGCCSVGGDV